MLKFFSHLRLQLKSGSEIIPCVRCGKCNGLHILEKTWGNHKDYSTCPICGYTHWDGLSEELFGSGIEIDESEKPNEILEEKKDEEKK